MKELKIEVVENGFIVHNCDSMTPAPIPGTYINQSIHVFESPQGLAEYIHEWGEKNKAVKPARPKPLPLRKEKTVVDEHSV